MAEPRQYAENTSVPTAKSLAEISTVLRANGCLGVQTSEEFTTGAITIRFAWPYRGANFVARLTVGAPTEKDVAPTMPTTIRPEKRAAWLVSEREQVLRSRMRVVLIKLKADFGMVRAGIISAVDVFLPYIEQADGQTIAQAVAPQLEAVAGGGSVRLLTDGGARG